MDTSEPTQTDEAMPARFGTGRSLLWVMASILIAACVGGVFSFLPPRLRLLGIFAIGEGIVIGLCLQRAVWALRINGPLVASLGGLVAGSLGFVMTCGFWWQTWAQSLADKPSPEAALAMQMLSQMQEPEDASFEELQIYREHRASMEAMIEDLKQQRRHDFNAWLAHRASAVTTGHAPATSIWFVELVLAGLASAVLCRNAAQRPYCLKCQNWMQPIRDHQFSPPLPEVLMEILPDEIERMESLGVVLSRCDCEGRRPEVTFMAQNESGSASLTMTNSDLSDSEFMQLKSLMDDAQGMG